MKYAFLSFITIVAFVFLINVAIMMFNTMNAWLGIGVGVVTIVSFLYIVYFLWKKTKELL